MQIRKLTEPGRYGDGAGLWLQVRSPVNRSWLFRYMVAGQARWLGLGDESVVSLAMARQKAGKAREALANGSDPIDIKRAEAEAKRLKKAAKSFEATADEYITAHKAGWKSEKHGKQWRATLEAYAFPLFGDKPVDTITVDHVLEALTPIWEAKPETASRVRGRIENTLDYAKTRGWRSGENPARWKGHLDHLLPARAKMARVVHHAALAWADLPGVMAKLADAGSTSALCLRFIILTAARSGEARGARRSEIDLAAKVWTVPAERMKAGVEHRVPLSDAAMAVLKAAALLKSGDDGLVFPGGRKVTPLSDVAVSKALASVADDVTVHGMRSTFRDWAAEETACPREVVETALAHTNRDKVEAAYARTDHLQRRRALMDDWAAHACKNKSSTDK
jgi:integrase